MKNTPFVYKKTNRYPIYSVNWFIGGGELSRNLEQFMIKKRIKRNDIRNFIST